MSACLNYTAGGNRVADNAPNHIQARPIPMKIRFTGLGIFTESLLLRNRGSILFLAMDHAFSYRLPHAMVDLRYWLDKADS